MKMIVVNEVSALLLRAPLSTSAALHIKKSDAGQSKEDTNAHARYYAAITFNQVLLSSGDADKAVAKKLCDVYFGMFQMLLGSGSGEAEEGEEGEGERVKGRMEMRKDRARKREGRDKDFEKAKKEGVLGDVADGNEKFLSAILTGLHRALPYASHDAALWVSFDFLSVFANAIPRYGSLEKHVNTLFSLTHAGTFNISLQALILIHSLLKVLPAQIEIRYFRTLYATLLDPRLAASGKQGLYLSLVSKSLGVKNSDDRNRSGGKGKEVMTKEEEGRLKAIVRRLCALGVLGLFGGGMEETWMGRIGEVDVLFTCFWTLLMATVKIVKEHQIVGDMLRAVSAPRASEGKEYDPKKREPEYSGAEYGCAWELVCSYVLTVDC